MTSSSDNKLVCQRVDAAAVLFPDKLKPAALGGAQVELEIRIGRNGLVQIGDEDVVSLITADKFVDDLARDDIAFVVVAQAGFHLMADQGFDLKDFALGDRAWYLYTRR